MSGPLDESLLCAGSTCGVSLSTLPRAASNEGLEQPHLRAPLHCPVPMWNMLQNSTSYILMLHRMARSTEDPALHPLVIECPSLSEDLWGIRWFKHFMMAPISSSFSLISDKM